jgi:N-terminal domain of anti-restriction factor ArdC/IrrE N-terminal-like domain
MDSVRPQPSAAELTAALRAGVARLTSSPRWQRHLAFQAAFSQYSFGNVMLIASQRPDATQVAGYATWRTLGRVVRRGESAIWILAPVHRSLDGRREEPDRRGVVGFRRVAVFDIAQTEGDDPPTVVEPLEGDDGAAVYPMLVDVAAELGFEVADAVLDGTTHGACDFARRQIVVEVANAPAQRVKTLLHEVAHAILHEAEENRPRAELEAESVAFIVGRGIGLATDAYSFGYVATWAGGGPQAIEEITRCGHRIARAARVIEAGLSARAKLSRAGLRA